MEELYRSLPLPAGSHSIRLLELEAPTASSLDKLRGKLRVACLRDRPRFTALSYVWGEGQKTISIDGTDFEVTTNCFDALMSLRAQYGKLTIWVDAIGINQKDMLEKNDQVPMMKEIYTWAATVYVWLGSGTAQSDAAMKCLRLVPKRYQCLYLTHWAASPSFARRAFAAIGAVLRTTYYIPVTGLHSLTHSSGHGNDRLDKRFKRAYRFEDMEELLSRDWLKRGWTYQEIILSCNPVIVCGNKSMSWDNFIRGIEYLIFAEACATERRGLPADLAYRHIRQPKMVSKLIEMGLDSLDPGYIASLSGDPDYMPTPTPIRMSTDDSEDLFRIPRQCVAWRGIFSTWMDLDRPTAWHGRKERRAVKVKSWLSKGFGSSFHLYQRWSSKRLHILWRLIFWAIFLSLLAWIPVQIKLGEAILNSEAPDDKIGPLGVLYIVTWVGTILGVFVSFFVLLGGCFTRGWGPIELFLTSGDYTQYGSKSTPAGALSVYKALRERHVSEPRDYAYAFHGVLEALGVDLTAPDYAKPVGPIYADLLKDLLKSGWTLNLLIIAGLPGFQNSPTWTPQWQSAAISTWLDDGYVYEDQDMSATPDSQSTHSFDEEGNLIVMASALGSIIFCSETLVKIHHGPQLDAAAHEANMHNIRILLHIITSIKLHSRLFGMNEVLSNGIFEILHARIKSRTYSVDQKHFASWFALILKALSVSDDISEQTTTAYAMLVADPVTNEYHTKICTTLGTQRTLFITSEGIIGTASRYVRPGDELYLVSGVSMPLVLRKDEDEERQLVSPAFVYGMMQGEKRFEQAEYSETRISSKPSNATPVDGADLIDLGEPLQRSGSSAASATRNKGKGKATSSPNATTRVAAAAASSSIDGSTNSSSSKHCPSSGSPSQPRPTPGTIDKEGESESQKVEQLVSDYRKKLLADAALSDAELQVKMMEMTK